MEDLNVTELQRKELRAKQYAYFTKTERFKAAIKAALEYDYVLMTDGELHFVGLDDEQLDVVLSVVRYMRARNTDWPVSV